MDNNDFNDKLSDTCPAQVVDREQKNQEPLSDVTVVDGDSLLSHTCPARTSARNPLMDLSVSISFRFRINLKKCLLTCDHAYWTTILKSFLSSFSNTRITTTLPDR